RWLAATHYYKFAIRRLFPLLKDTICASYSISIKHHENFMALSNMPKIWEDVEVDGNNMQWTRFQTTPVMPVYFIAAGVFNLSFITNWNTKLLYRKDILPYMTFAYNVAKNIAWFLSHIRKTKITNHIAIPELLDAEEIILGFVLYR
ncbi:Laeverin, partial [Camponotus floridanus]